MSDIHYNLANGASLGGMAPAAQPGGLFGNAALPQGLQGGGIYMIVNNAINPRNRYVGISINLQSRFNTRMATVTELGLPDNLMNQIYVYWGTIQIRDSPTALAPNPPFRNLQAYGAPLVAAIDQVQIYLEQLLVRIMLTQWVPGDTVSNNIYANNRYVNPTNNDINVQVSWGGGGLFQAGNHAVVWPSPGAAQARVNQCIAAVQQAQQQNQLLAIQQAQQALQQATQLLAQAQLGW